MKLEKTKISVNLAKDEKKALELLAHETDLQCAGIDCDECPFHTCESYSLHAKCMYEELTLLASDVLNIVKGCE